ncbi:FLR1 [Candida oxycetoniae]|uniref:FLR1 n=1 Tax=Candida oxycetoniae TaxID=497107 RepID=A0AAI9X046_9ASCO|nr:FLR1 [Candida oxycetoniae]KAI3406878.2 FLR1 [Candida oxycetoniae]
MKSFVKDSFVGQILYRLSGRKIFLHRDELPDYVIPEKYLVTEKQLYETTQTSVNSEKEDSKDVSSSSDSTVLNSPAPAPAAAAAAASESKDSPKNDDYIIVTWDGDDDPENPYNWSFGLKAIMAFQISFLTVSVYMASAIYTPGVEDIMEKFNISQTLATLPLSMFVIGYGIGPIFFSPLSEHSRIGRTYLYIITLFIFCMMQIPTALSTSIAGMSVLRLIAGFFASPALSTGGASYGDFINLPYFVVGLASWSLGAVCGPALGPLIGSVLVVRGGHNGYESWRWTFWFMALISSCFLIFGWTLPETYAPYLLRKKAERLRRLTGNDRIRSEAEIKSEGEHTSVGKVLKDLLWRPIEITIKEPVVLLIDIYIALVYSVMYLFFEGVPIVFQETKHFTLVEMGVAYTSIVIGIVIAGSIFIPYVYQIFTKKLLAGNMVVPEIFIPAAIVGAILMPIGLFIFGWTSSPHIHWFPPLIGIALFAAGAFLIFQTLFNYMASSFKVEYLASVFSSNAFFRSVSAGCFPLFGRALFLNLGSDNYPVGWGSSLLAFIACVMIAIPVFFYLNGPKLRARSLYAY